MVRFIAEAERSADTRVRTERPRAEGLSSEVTPDESGSVLVSAAESHLQDPRAEHQPCVPPPAESSARSLQSVRAERVWKSPSQRPLAKARNENARAFCDACSECYRRYGDAYTNTAIARSCLVTERTVRDWRSGAKRLPLEVIPLLPSMLRERMVDNLQRSLSGGLEKRALPELTGHLDKVERQLANEDRFEAMKVLAAAQGRIAELMSKAMGGK